MAGQRRKRGGRVTPKGGAAGRSSPPDWMGLEDIFAKLVMGVGGDLSDRNEALEVEMWASQMWSVWQELSGGGDTDPVELFAGGLIAYCAGQATSEAQTVLRAMGAVAPDPYGSKARRAARRVAQSGVVEASWAEAIGAASAASAWLSFDPVDDDGVSVMVGFEGPSGAHTLGVYVDHNLGGIAKDGFAVPAPVEEAVARLRESDDTGPVEFREISVAEAAARWRDAFKMTDRIVEPPVTEDLRQLRALLRARLSAMPVGGEVPAHDELSKDRREQLVAEFLATGEAATLWDVDGVERDDVEHLAFQAMTFSLDYLRGTPLRFSPVMVEMFSLDWAPRKIPASEDAFTLLPDVLAAWIRFVGGRRAIAEESISEAVEAVYRYAPEMIDLSLDPTNWDPAKTIALAVQQRGIDITDRVALGEFMAEVNRRGGIDVLADSLVARR
ncbi:MAG: hypothetical protein QOE15_2224 [Acidimicrobiaceae bacterium]|nr:hypothetical protein [Acidimicrobiaceae bacterium]